MEKLREEFLKETIKNLTEVEESLKNAASVEDFINNVFPKIHTIKGSSSAFGLTAHSRLTHEIESLLQNSKNNQNEQKEWVYEVLEEGIKTLKNLFEKSLENQEVEFPKEISAKISYLLENESKSQEITLPPNFPQDMIIKLSSFEKKNVQTALLKDKVIILAEVALDIANFTETFKELRNKLSQEAEIIANFSVANADKITFQILLATSGNVENVFLIIEDYQGKIEFQTFNFPKNELFGNEESLENILRNVISDGKKVAGYLGKSVSIETFGEEKNLPENYLKVISISLLHLVRNAIAHGIEKPMERIAKNKSAQGLVKVEFAKIEKGYRLTVTDNGQGIDVDKIKKVAKQQNILESNFEINEEEAKQLIFKSGFSTSNEVSEISGRGIGLQAVETEIKKINGKIRVYSKTGVGTLFEILIPHNN